MKRILFLLLIFSQLILRAQTDTVYKFSVDQAVEFALKNNLTITNAQLEIRKAKWKIWETTALGLPQVNGQVQFQDFLDIPTQLMPNFMLPVVVGINTQYFGLHPIQPLPETDEKIPVQFGSKYNVSWGITVSQLIFNGEYLVGLKTSKIFKDLSEQNYQKAQIDLKANVHQAYVLALIAEESEKILDSNLLNINQLLQQTKEMVKVGLAEQIKLDQLSVLQLTLENQLKSIRRQKILAYSLLKFQLGLQQTDSLVLTDDLNTLLAEAQAYTTEDFNPVDNINYKLAKTQEQLALMDLRRSQSKLLPSVSGIFSYSEKAMRDEFDIFDKDKDWFKSSLIGITVQIPIFGSGQKIAQIQQKKIALMEAQNRSQLLEQQLIIQYQQAKSTFFDAYAKYLNAKENLKLSEKIYKNTQISFSNGTASSFELTQAQNQYLEKQANYYQAVLELIKAKIELEKLNNQ